MGDDDTGLGARLRRLLELLDDDLERVYAEIAPGYRPRFTPVMKALRHRPLTIKAIAGMSGVSHSAASQTVSRMVADGWVAYQVGDDARERLIRLTDTGKAALPVLETQWTRTDRAAQGLEAEIAAPLGALVSAAIRALEDRPFRDRIRP